MTPDKREKVMKMQFVEKSIVAFTDDLAAKTPVPGGGGASALVAALGTALGGMVGNFTVGKPKYAAVEEDMQALLARGEALRGKLLSCIDRDAEAFEPLSRAYGIPREDPQRPAVLEQCLKEAAAVPMEILRLACEAIELHAAYAQKGSAMMLSDVGTGVAFCWSALYGAALNVRVNTKLMKDRSYAQTLDQEVEERMEQYREMAEQVYQTVYQRIC